MQWNLKEKPDKATVQQLATALGIPEAVAILLVQRGITSFEEAKDFYRPSLEALHDPFLMQDMQAAVARIERAIAEEELIMVYGDYDVDGTCSVALMASYLLQRYPRVTTYIPDRYAEGYGVSLQGIDFAHDNGVGLIIALDCGVKAIDQVDYAAIKGIDFIICDHHTPGEALPNAVAVLDPKRSDCQYPYKELCGCGVGFKLIQALGQNRGEQLQDLLPYLDLVATAIAADIVPMTGENRVLAAHGLQVVNENPRPGIQALLGQRDKETYDISDLVFVVAPRINAAGRMKHGDYAVALLMADAVDSCLAFAQEIEAFNASRRATDEQITAEALAKILDEQEEDRSTTVVYEPHWHKGVIGIVASRLIEQYYRPTLVITKSGEVLAGSARSVSGFDVYEALAACKEHMIQFGGHKYAAGFTLEESEYENFKAAFEKVVGQTLDDSLKIPQISVDLELSFADITPKFYRLIKQFAPFGPGNRTPVFATRNLTDSGWAKPVGSDGSHLKFKATDGQFAFDAIGFGLGKKIDLIKDKAPFDLVYSLDENHWNGRVSLQLRAKDLKKAES
ncbi:single-stranded-DNA-specific exonuclease RecJ [Gilvibacter sp.]|uniref:single-stranded-DNA-specific exonuclease RecJ n=1 Tax=Gilvibacter sp. TaxID=2729997 RepID=UPI0035BE37C8